MNMINSGSVFNLFEGIAEKEMLMYQAVIDMVQEDYDVNRIKVSDITSRAGIGKGTAYEYFSNKEEIIVKALLFDTYSHLKKIEAILLDNKKYKEKYFLLLDYLERNIPQTKSFGSLMRMFAGTYEIKENIKIELSRIEKNGECPIIHVERMIDEFMKQGLEENVYTQEDVILCRCVFETQLTGYIYCIMNHYYGGSLSKEKAREFSFEGIVKLLSA